MKNHPENCQTYQRNSKGTCCYTVDLIHQTEIHRLINQFNGNGWDSEREKKKWHIKLTIISVYSMSLFSETSLFRFASFKRSRRKFCERDDATHAVLLFIIIKIIERRIITAWHSMSCQPTKSLEIVYL